MPPAKCAIGGSTTKSRSRSGERSSRPFPKWSSMACRGLSAGRTRSSVSVAAPVDPFCESSSGPIGLSRYIPMDPKQDTGISESESQRSAETVEAARTGAGSTPEGRSAAAEPGEQAAESDVDVIIVSFDDIDNETVAFDMLVEREVIVLDTTEEEDVRQVHELRDTARERRIDLAGATHDTRTERRSRLKEATDKLKETWSRVREKIES